MFNFWRVKKVSLARVGAAAGVSALLLTFLFFTLPARAFLGPSTGQSPGSGGGLFSVDPNRNVGFGTYGIIASSTHATPPFTDESGFSRVFMIASTSTPPGIALRNIATENTTTTYSLTPATYVWRLTSWGWLELFNATDQTYGGRAIFVMQDGKVGIGHYPTSPSEKLMIQGGNVRVSGGAFVGSLSGSLSAANVSGPSAFGSNYGTYNYAFPGALAIGTSTTTGLPTSGLYVGGNVGIGTTSPGAKLEVKSSGNDVYVLQAKTSGSTNSIWGVYQDASGNGHMYVRNVSGTARIALASDDGSVNADILSLGYGGTVAKITTADTNENLTIDPNGAGNIIMQGNVGIGTSTPAYKLDVVGTGRFTQPVIVDTPTGDTHAATKSYVDSMFTGSGQWTTNGGLVYLTSTTQSVGIGTTAPGTKVSIQMTEDALRLQDATLGAQAVKSSPIGGTINAIQFYYPDGTNPSVQAAIRLVNYNTVGTGWYNVLDRYSAGLSFDTVNAGVVSEKMTIKSDGNVGIGTTSPGEKLEVAQGNLLLTSPAGSSAGLYIKDLSGNSIVELRDASGAEDEGWLRLYNNAAAETVRLVAGTGNSWITGGNVGIGTTAPGQKLSVENGEIGVVRTDGGEAIYNFGNSETTSGRYLGRIAYNFTDNRMSFSINGNYSAPELNIKSGNVGIGTSTPAYKLDVWGTGSFTQPVVVGTPTGNSHATTKSYVDSMFTGSGQWTTNGGLVYLTSTTQSVGIGTAGPDGKLHIDIGKGTQAFDKGIVLEAGDGSFTTGEGPMLQFENEDVIMAGIRGYREGGWASALQFFTHNSSAGNTYGTTFLERMRIDSSGNVGIGTSTPGARLTLQTSGTTDILNLIETGGTEVFTVLESGNVGIGTTNPLSKLDVNGTISVRDGAQDDITLSPTATGGVINVRDTNGDGVISIDARGTAPRLLITGSNDLSTSFAAKINGLTTTGLAVTNAGNVGIGTTAPATPLDVRLAGTASGGVISSLIPSLADSGYSSIYFGHSLATAKAGVIEYHLGTTGASYADSYIGLSNYGDATSLAIKKSGNVGIGTTSPGAKLHVNGSFKAVSSGGIAQLDASGNFIIDL